ncbi:IclR family transcriptional regulator [Enteractinococcus fodinae]
MAMLVYRGYVEQDASRRYVPGPAMGLTPTGLSWTAELRHRARTHMEALTDRVGETSNLVVLSGDAVRFLSSVEPEGEAQAELEEALEQGQLPKISEREGVALPAHKASGGKAILAELDPQHVEAIFERTRTDHPDDSWMTSLRNELAVVRARGFATNVEGTEAGVSAVGVSIRDGHGKAIAGLSVSVPHTRFSGEVRRKLVDTLWRTKSSLESDLTDFVVRR